MTTSIPSPRVVGRADLMESERHYLPADEHERALRVRCDVCWADVGERCLLGGSRRIVGGRRDHKARQERAAAWVELCGALPW